MSLALPLPDNYLSRAPQQQARRAVEQAVLAGEKSISFSMPTGTGKTRVWVALLVALFVSGFHRFILVLPNLNLLDQLKRDYMEKLGWNKKKGVFYVCSEPGTDAIDEADFRRSFPAASEADLRKIYARKQFLIVTTYASLPKVLRDLPATSPVDALFMDEAHHEEGPVVLEALETHSAKYKHKISGSATLLPSHQPCYTYSLSAAIHDNVIKDYQLYICLMLATGTGTSQSKIKFIKEIAAKTGNTHLIVYVTFSEADREDTTSVRKLVAELAGDPELWVEGLTGGHTREQRQATQTAFATPLKGAEKVKLLVNCRVLGEGADISAANGVVFDKTTTDSTQLQQNIGRALRKPDGETVPAAAVLFMILVSAEELAAVAPGAERNAALVEQVYDTGPGRFAMVAIAGLMKQDPAKVRELMGDNQRVAFTRARPDRAVVETAKETVRLTRPDGFDDEEEEDLNGLADAITMSTDWPAAEVQTILRGLTEGSESCYDEDSDEDSDSESRAEGSSDEDSESRAGSSSTASSEEQEPFVQRLSDRLGYNVVIHHAEDGIVASEPAGAYDETLELLKTPTGFDLVVPAADKDNERYKPKQRLRPRPMNFMLEQDLKELVSLGLSDDTDLTHGLTARLEVQLTAKTRAELASAKVALFHKAVGVNGVKALAFRARVDEEGQLVAKDADGWGDAWQVGSWFNHTQRELKNPSKKVVVYASLTQDDTNEIVKAKLEKFLAKQDKPAVWHHDLTHEDKLALFFKAVELNAKALKQHVRVDGEGRVVAKGADGWPVGGWFTNKKNREFKDPAKKAATYDMLTQDGTNEIVKEHLKKFLADQAKPAVWHHDLTHEDKLALFFKAVELNAKALVFNARVDEEGQLVAKGADGWDDAWLVGHWFNNRKTRELKDPSKKAATYDMLTQNGTNEIVKTNLKKFLAKQDKPAVWHHDLTNEGKFALYYKAVELNDDKALVKKARVDEEGVLVAKDADGWDDAWQVGHWFDTRKQKMKDPSKKDAVYDMLTQNGTNEIVKEHLKKFLADQDKKKRKASDAADEEMEVYDDVATAPLVLAAAAATAAEPPKKRQKTTAAPPPPAAAPAVPAPPASRKRPAAAATAALEEQEQQEEQPKPKRARKQPAPKEPKKYNELSEAERDKIIKDHLARKQKPAGYCTTNPEAKDNINGVLARYVPPAAAAEAASDAKVIFLDHIEFKTAYALLETGRVRPEDMLIPQRDPAHYEEMARHELFGPSVVPGDFNEVLERFLAEGNVVRSVYADFCSTQQAVGLPFVELLTKYRTQLAPAAVVGVTVTRRNPEGVRYQGQDIVKMNTALLRLLEREPENLFHTAQMTGTDGQPLDDDDPYTYGDGQPMATWLIRTAF